MAFALSSAGKGKGRTVKIPDDVRAIRERMELSQSAFASSAGRQSSHFTGLGTGSPQADLAGLCFAACCHATSGSSYRLSFILDIRSDRFLLS